MITFLHTSDWQLGMTRYFLDEGAQERYSQARFDSIRTMGRVVRDEGCAFVAVCGDVFESNQVNRKTVLRALEALREVPAPVYLLPGNHDPLNEASIYLSPVFLDNKPDNVAVVSDHTPIRVADGVELAGAPWPAKRLAANPVHALLDALPPDGDALRIILAHGSVDALAGFSDGDSSAAVISLERLRAALADGRAHFVALGDKHSVARVDDAGRVWYSGTPEPTSFREPDPGHATVVALDRQRVEVRKAAIGTWRFTEIEENALSGPDDIARLDDALRALPDKERRIVRLRLGGVLDLRDIAGLEERLAGLGDLFASLEVRQESLHSRVDAADIPGDRFTGFAADTLRDLEKRVAAGRGDAVAARDAILLLMRLSRPDGEGAK